MHPCALRHQHQLHQGRRCLEADQDGARRRERPCRRAAHSAGADIALETLLGDGKVLVTGLLGVAEVYDPVTGTWAELDARSGITFDSAALLSNGTVLLTWGGDPPQSCAAGDLYDPRTGSWAKLTGIPSCRSSFTPLLDSTVLVAGGRDCNEEGQCVSTREAALYVPVGVRARP